MHLHKLALLLLLWMSVMGTQANAACCKKDPSCIDVTGKASYVHADKAYARQMAIRDALQLAVLRWGGQIRSQQKVEKFQLTQSQLTVHAKGKVRGFTILSEGDEPDDKLYTVKLKVCLAPLEDACPNPLASGLKPRLAVGPLVINQPYAIRDIRNLPQGFVKALMRKLTRDYGNAQSTDTTAPLLNATSPVPNLDQAVLQTLQEETGAQFLLLTALRDADLRRKPDFTGINVLDQALEEGRRFYSESSTPNRRSLTLDWYIVDLNHNRLLAQGQFEEQVRGAVYVGRDKPFDTVAFYKTPTGQAFARLLELLASEVMAPLKCAPFEARILEVNTRDGQQEIVFFATPESGLKVGDQLTVYHMEEDPVRMADKVLGWRTAPSGFVQITQMQDEFAVGKVVAKKGRIEVNDWVKSW